MEKKIQSRIEDYTSEFKDNIRKWFDDNQVTVVCGEDNENKKSQFLQYMIDFPNLVLEKEDFKKRKRMKNSVSNFERCQALKENGDRCSRKKKGNGCFCGTHEKGSPHGKIDDDNEEVKKKKTIEVWLQEIQGVHHYIDKFGNVYHSEDIISGNKEPRIIFKYNIDLNNVYRLE
jgi:hypothetical protein